MISAFVTLRVTDIIDVLLVAYLLYQLYLLVRETSAFNIFIAIFGMFVFWVVVRALKMELMAGIMKQVFSVGLIALVVLFQPEIRRFLARMGERSWNRKRFSFQHWLFSNNTVSQVKIDTIVESCVNMSVAHQGALIVIQRKMSLKIYEETGDIINADTVSRLLESLFFKNSSMHDGAVIIVNDKIVAARCVLPLSENLDLPPYLGLRHRAGLGIVENTDAVAIIVSEETGHISFADNGVLHEHISPEELLQYLQQG